MNKIKDFIKSNIVLSVGFIICLIIVSSYEYTKLIPEMFSGGDFIFSLFVQISLAYIGSFVFYIMQVYIPRKKEEERINTCIATPIYRIIKNIEIPIMHFKNKVIGEDRTMESITEKEYEEICNAINPLDDAPIIFTDGREGCYKDYIYEHIKNVENYSKQILTYVTFIDSKLVSIIDDIFNSKYHEIFKLYYDIKECGNQNIEFLTEHMIEYYNKMQELSEYARVNNLISKYEY